MFIYKMSLASVYIISDKEDLESFNRVIYYKLLVTNNIKLFVDKDLAIKHSYPLEDKERNWYTSVEYRLSRDTVISFMSAIEEFKDKLSDTMRIHLDLQLVWTTYFINLCIYD